MPFFFSEILYPVQTPNKLLIYYFTLYVIFFPIINTFTMYFVQHKFSIQHHSHVINESYYWRHVLYYSMLYNLGHAMIDV